LLNRLEYNFLERLWAYLSLQNLFVKLARGELVSCQQPAQQRAQVQGEPVSCQQPAQQRAQVQGEPVSCQQPSQQRAQVQGELVSCQQSTATGSGTRGACLLSTACSEKTLSSGLRYAKACLLSAILSAADTQLCDQLVFFQIGWRGNFLFV
jgi:hypothetical protein